MGIHTDSKGSRNDNMCSMVWGFRCSRDDAKGQTWQEMVRKKRENTPGNWREESRFPGTAHPRSRLVVIFSGDRVREHFQWRTFVVMAIVNQD